MNEFRLIHLDQRQHLDVTINGRRIPTSREGTMLGLTILSTGYSTHIKRKKNLCKLELGKMWRLRELGEKNKRTMYLALISSRLHYPPIPTHCLSDLSIRTLQRAENSGARCITNISRMERKTNLEVNRRAQLEPLNQSLYSRALKIWNKIRVETERTRDKGSRGGKEGKNLLQGTE